MFRQPTEPITISGQSAITFLNSLRHPDSNYIRKRDAVLDNITVTHNGYDIEVEISDFTITI